MEYCHNLVPRKDIAKRCAVVEVDIETDIKETLKHIKLKHPQPKKGDKNALLSDISEKIHAVKFESIDVEIVRQDATKTMGGSDPSGMDSNG